MVKYAYGPIAPTLAKPSRESSIYSGFGKAKPRITSGSIKIVVMPYLYILKLRDLSYYVGSCRDINKRLSNHHHGQVISTKGKLPFTVMLIKEFKTYPEARKEEMRVKKWKSRSSIENLIKFDKSNMVNLAPSSSG